MTRERNIEAQEKFAEGVNTGNFEVFSEVMSPSVVDNDPAPIQGSGPEGFKDFFRMMRSAFPDLEVKPERIVATDEDVALAYTITGTHQGDFLGVSPTGKRIEARGSQVTRFENGVMVERWGSSDELGILQQLDAVDVKTADRNAEDKGLIDKAKDKLSGQ